MARPLKHWGCDFRCGFTNSNRKRVNAHEAKCFSNPAVRACRTCHYLNKEDDLFCSHEGGPDTFYDGDGKLTLRQGCDLWEPNARTAAE